MSLPDWIYAQLSNIANIVANKTFTDMDTHVKYNLYIILNRYINIFFDFMNVLKEKKEFWEPSLQMSMKSTFRKYFPVVPFLKSTLQKYFPLRALFKALRQKYLP